MDCCTYFSIGFIFGSVFAILAITILIGEFLFWASHYIRHQNKPRDYFWSKFNDSIEEIDSECYYMALFFFGIVIGPLLIAGTWPVAIPVLIIIGIVLGLRYRYGKKLEEK